MDVEDAYVNPYATNLVDPLVGQKIEEVRSSVRIDNDGHKVVTISVFVGMGWDWYDRVVVVQSRPISFRPVTPTKGDCNHPTRWL